jgi:uncharacterized protein YndB with AHSA1/START domain
VANARTYQYITEWKIDAPVEAVWDAITDVESWPRWWRHVRSVHLVRRGDANGVGDVRRLRWGSRLPYGITLETSTVAVELLRRLTGRARGDLEGTGTWELTRDGEGTLVRYTWRIELASRWMRLAAPLMAPVFKWNHDGVMHDGGTGLAKYLTAPRPPQAASTPRRGAPALSD